MDATSISRYRATELALWRTHGAEPIERWVEIRPPGVRVRVLEVGDGPPVLFVHGVAIAGSTWAALAARLQGRRCLVLDRPGCGLSEPMRCDRIASPSVQVDVQVGVLDELGIERADVVGSSYGGACVLWLAAARPGRVDRIVLEGAPGMEGFTPIPAIRVFAAGPIGRYVARRRVSRARVEAMYRQLGHRRLVGSGWPGGADLAWNLSCPNDTDTLRNEVGLIQAIATWRGFRRGRLFDPAGLSRIAQPTLWLWGANEPYATVEQGRSWAAAMPDATFELLHAAGHAPWLDDPERHARRLERFLSADIQSDEVRAPIGASA